jgi:uncharacterized protein
MHYHLILTQLCNSECKYCYEKSFKEFDNHLEKKFKFDFSEPDTSVLDISKLKEFLAKDKEAVLIFYGGEPLLELDKIKKIIDTIKVPFRMQTNGKLLNKISASYLNKIDKILVSIDGDKERTDYNKGKGTYDKVVSNIKLIRKNGFKGEIVARMTISPEIPASDICGQVNHLFSLGLFDSVHWQIDAGFYKFDFDKEKFQSFVKDYNKGIDLLIDYWLDQMKKGRVLKIYPFLAIIDSLLKKEKTLLRCGAGYAGYAISTTGKLVACPIMNSIVDFEAGNINSSPSKLKNFKVGGKCGICEVKDLCGGRCLYWREAELWPDNGNELICNTIKHYLGKLKEKLPQINDLIRSGKIKKQNFEYEKYFGPEIIP